jgi:hypothetical protein
VAGRTLLLAQPNNKAAGKVGRFQVFILIGQNNWKNAWAGVWFIGNMGVVRILEMLGVL